MAQHVIGWPQVEPLLDDVLAGRETTSGSAVATRLVVRGSSGFTQHGRR